MARVTVEDCLDSTTNRFQLVLLASKRARLLSRGALPLVEEEDDKPTVLALREIAAGKVSKSLLNDDDDRVEGSHFFAEEETEEETEEEADGNSELPSPEEIQPPDENEDEESAERRFMEVMGALEETEKAMEMEYESSFLGEVSDEALSELATDTPPADNIPADNTPADNTIEQPPELSTNPEE
jgi:DNA-directed RNA polymerase subunit omega